MGILKKILGRNGLEWSLLPPALAASIGSYSYSVRHGTKKNKAARLLLSGLATGGTAAGVLKHHGASGKLPLLGGLVGSLVGVGASGMGAESARRVRLRRALREFDRLHGGRTPFHEDL